MFLKSLFFMEKEKLAVLIKELQSPYLICDFYATQDIKETVSQKIDLQHDFYLIKHEIIIIKKRIEDNYENIEVQTNIIKNNEHKYEIQSLIYLDILRQYIKNEIQNVGKVNEKISQLLRDGYNEYLPKPILGKRFSSVNITSHVELSLSNRMKEINNSNKANESLIVWDYTEDYKILEKKYFTSFHLSYWYFEFSYFLPNLTHELGHILLKEGHYLKEEKKLKLFLEKLIQNNISFSNFPNKKYIPKNLSDEILADIIAFTYHGSSFFYSLTHKLFGHGLSHMFEAKPISENGKKTLIYDVNNMVINTQSIDIRKSFTFKTRYTFNQNNDFTYIRLALLLSIEERIQKNIQDKRIKEKFKIIDSLSIKRLLNSIYYVDENLTFSQTTLSDLNSIFEYDHIHNNDSQGDGYRKTSKIIKTLYSQINQHIIADEYNYFLKAINQHKHNSTKREEIPRHFNDIWKKRLNALSNTKEQAVHRFEFRKKIHRVTLTKLIEEGLLSIENLKPYNMVFLKYNLNSITDLYRTNNLKVAFDDNLHQDICQGIVLGIYDYVYFRKLDGQYELKLNEFKPKNYTENNIRYFESNYSLMKIMNDTINTQESNEYLNAIIQIEVPKFLNNPASLQGEQNSDIYDNLFKNLKEIRKLIETSPNSKFKKVEYFKSLGPKDITLRIDSASIEYIFQIKKELAKKFPRTFTTFYVNNIPNQTYNSIISSTQYTFVSTLRMNPNYDHQNFEALCKEEKRKGNIIKVAQKTGVMDFQVLWKAGINFQVLVNFYKLLTKKVYSPNFMVSDIQTSIDMNII